MICEAGFYNAFYYFGYERKVRDWTVVIQLIFGFVDYVPTDNHPRRCTCIGVILESETCIFVADVKLLTSFEAPDAVHGLAVLQKKLYVLRKRQADQLYVYDTKDYKLQYTITIPGLEPFMYNDLTECVKENCLFVSDFGAKSIRKVEPNGEQSKVSKFIDVPYQPKGLSITPEGNLLVACNPNKLVEFSVKTGDKVCEVDLHLEVKYPLHAVKRTDGQYVVCHTDEKLSRVCRVGADGYYRHCFGGLKGAEAGQMNYACHVTLREDNYVIVADNDNNRLVMLDGSMDYVDTIVENFREPHRVWFDAETHARRLYVGECTDNGCVKVFKVGD